MIPIVHLGGFVRSGAAAVRDALLDTGAFLSVKGKSFAASESRLFSGGPSIPAFVATAEGLGPDDVLALWTAGTRVPEDARLSTATRRFLRTTATSHAINRKSFQKVGLTELRDAAAMVAAAVGASTDPASRSATYIRATYAALRTLLPTEGRAILLNNDPAATGIAARHLRLDPATLFIAVIRDPSNQYVDRRLGVEPDESRARNLLHTTASGLMRRRQLRAIADTAAEFPSRCLIVEFERFVREPDYRAHLLAVAVAGTTTRRPEGEPRFAAERSVRNVGLAVPARDTLQHAVYTRLCAQPHATARARSGPDAWPDPAPDTATGRDLEER